MSFRTPARFSFFDDNYYFCSDIAKSANFAENAQYQRFYIAQFFRKKTFGDIGPPPVYTSQTFKITFADLQNYIFFRIKIKVNYKLT
jgi:hypothetical protein